MECYFCELKSESVLERNEKGEEAKVQGEERTFVFLVFALLWRTAVHSFMSIHWKGDQSSTNG